MATICLISQLHPSLNPRLTKEADALSEAGHDVVVIAPDFSEWARKADEALQGRRWRIVERPKYGPSAPALTRFAELARRGVATTLVRVFGVMQPMIARAAWHPAAPALVRAARRQKADLYIAHLVASLPAAAIAARHNDAQYAFDAEDFHPGDLPDEPRYATDRRMVASIEGRYLRGCSYVTAASPLIAEAYRDEYQIELPVTILNAFPPSQAPPAPTARGVAYPGPSVYWFSQTIGPDRGLECAVKGIAISKSKPHLYLRGEPARGYVESLTEIARELGVEDRLHFLSRAMPSEMERLASNYDVGFAGETGGTRNHQIALSNKQFTYLLAGLPIVMSDTPAHRAFAWNKENCIRLYRNGDDHSLADALDSFLGDPGVLEAARKQSFALGQTRFNWDVEKTVLLRTVERALLNRSKNTAVAGEAGSVRWS